MRAPFQILAIPYQRRDDGVLYGVLHRSDCDAWQFIAGGGEDEETPIEAAKREILEEGGLAAEVVCSLQSMCFVPVDVISPQHRRHWKKDLYVIPEYSFGFACDGSLVLSCEHRELVWLPYEQAMERLQWDSNRTALYELDCILSEHSDK